MSLETSYMGLKLNSPLVVSACPLSEKTENIEAMANAGAGAVVLFSLFEEQIVQEQAAYEYLLQHRLDPATESADLFDDDNSYKVTIAEYLDLISDATKKVDIPVIGSLNGISQSGWLDYAKKIEKAGANGLELNVYYLPGNVKLSAEKVENRYLGLIREAKANLSIPISLKLNPYFSNMGNITTDLAAAGADAVVLFNRFYMPDFDIDKIELDHSLELSSASEIRLPLLWLSILYDRVPISLAANTGVQSSVEVIKYILAGADCVMAASVFLKHGIDYMRHMLDEVKVWMDNHGYDHLEQWKGKMSRKYIPDPTLYERANYIKVLDSYRYPVINL